MESAFIKHLAYENANPTCQEAIRPHRGSSLSDYIKLCSGIGTSHAIGLAVGAALQQFSQDKQQTKQQKACFNCKQPGHFFRECPQDKQPRPLPKSICPRCRRGFHWASECYSKTGVDGNTLPPKQGNSSRGQPLAPPLITNPGAIRFVSQKTPQQIQTLPTQVSAPSAGPPQVAQDWTSVPPPIQY